MAKAKSKKKKRTGGKKAHGGLPEAPATPPATKRRSKKKKKTAKKTSAPGAAAPRLGRKPSGITEKKQRFVRGELRRDPTITRNAMQDLIRAEFGTMIPHPKLADVYDELGIKSRRGPRKGLKRKATKRKKSTNGRRRGAKAAARKTANRRGPGRRQADVTASTAFTNLRKQPEFLVTTLVNGTLDVAAFGSEGAADSYIKGLIVEQGIAYPQIGYYARFEANINIKGRA